VIPKPIQRPHPPFRLAANSPDTFSFAGANAYPIFAGGPVNPINVLPERLALYRGALEAAGRKLPGDWLAAMFLTFPGKDQAAVHCSGAAELSVLKTQAQVGGFHPLQMFADAEVAARGLAGCAIAVEAEEPLLSVLKGMVSALRGRLLVIPPGARAAYHAGAHYAAAFVCALLAEGVEVWNRIGIPPHDALAALLPLLRGATDAVAHSGPARAMAGSIARGDAETVKRHVEALEALDPKLAELYRTLALRTVPLALAAGGLLGAA